VPSEFSKALEGLSRLTGGEDGEASGSWLTEAAKSPANRAGQPQERLDTSDWFDSQLPPAREQPEAQIRASDASAETRQAHDGLSFDSTGAAAGRQAQQQDEQPEEPGPDGPLALPPTAAPGAYPQPAGQMHVPPPGQGRPS
jgi:hypothetical protein